MAMQNLQLTLETASANLALDEGLLAWAEANQSRDLGPPSLQAPSDIHGILRLWEPKQYFVVLGRSSQPQQEVDLATCRGDGIPVLRRCSGGATIVAGPGCLMYALVLGYPNSIQSLPDIGYIHQFVLTRMTQALSHLASGIVSVGTSDLAIPMSHIINNKGHKNKGQLHKFSGNSLRCKRTHFLYHGTLLYDFDLPKIGRWLRMPPRQPAYRSVRPHDRFVTNLPTTCDQLRHALIQGWQALQPLNDWPRARTAKLTREKFHEELGASIFNY